jgi:hypothetical protein
LKLLVLESTQFVALSTSPPALSPEREAALIAMARSH